MEATKETNSSIIPIIKPIINKHHGIIKSLQETMITMDMTQPELIKYYENKYKRCYECKARNKNYKITCDCHKKKKCSGCHKLIKQCINESIYCEDPSIYDYI
jgi:hypothetical protein